MYRAILVSMLAVAAHGAALARPQAQTPAAVSGTVVSTESPARPIRRAIVTLTGERLVNNLSTVTDDRGAFGFTNLVPGVYTISATKPAYLTTAHGARGPGRPGTPVSLGAGQRVTDVRLALARGAVIGGTLRDATGAPAASVHVTVVPAARASGPSEYLSPAEGSIVTDERGTFRAYGLAPGEYLVAATPRSAAGGTSLVQMSSTAIDALLRDLKSRASGVVATGAPSAAPAASAGARPMTYAPIFYPGTPIVQDAARVRVAAGEVQDRLDFVVDLVPIATVSGRMVTTDGSPLPGTQLSLTPIGPPLPVFDSLRFSATQAADGTFSYANVTPGRYVLSVRGTAGTPPTVTTGRGGSFGGSLTLVTGQRTFAALLWASADLSVNGADVTGLTLLLRPGLTFTGTIAFEGTPPAAADLAKTRVGLSLPDGAMPTVMNGVVMGGLARPLATTVTADGKFTIANVTPGTYVPTAYVPGSSTWMLRSAIVNGRDVLDLPLEISGSASDTITGVLTLTERRSALAGTIQSASGQPATDYVIVVFPVDRALWPAARRLKLTRPATNGRFSFADLPSGDYLLAALSDVDPDDWQRADFLEQIVSAAVRVTIADGATVNQDLRIK